MVSLHMEQIVGPRGHFVKMSNAELCKIWIATGSIVTSIKSMFNVEKKIEKLDAVQSSIIKKQQKNQSI